MTNRNLRTARAVLAMSLCAAAAHAA